MPPEIRFITDSEFDATWDAAVRTFGWPATDADRAQARPWNEIDRIVAAFDHDQVVATAGVLSVPMVVPGSAVAPAAAVTLVTTSPTHRRRGLMRGAMSLLLDQARDRSESLATLWASESSIYGSLGFGAAIDSADAEIAIHHAALRPDAPVGTGRIRVYDDDSIRPVVRDLYLEATRDDPGTMIRREPDWDVMFADPSAARDGKPRARFAVYEEDGRARGFVRYRNVEEWKDHNAEGTVAIIEMHTLDATAMAELWRFLTSIDLMSTITIHLVRPRSRIAALLLDPRRLRLSMSESIWVRILNAPAALEARRYSVEGDLVIDVDDPMGYAAGRFRLQGGPDGAEVTATDAAPDVSLGVDALGSAYLGAPRIGDLAWAGRVRGDPDAVDLLDAMLRWHVEPRCTYHF